nr:MAG TPA: hypothetical protein [Caudoviricetes sp.]
MGRYTVFQPCPYVSLRTANIQNNPLLTIKVTDYFLV